MDFILVIDDDPIIRDLFPVILDESRYQVVAVGTLREAVEALKKNTFRGIICDLSLANSDPPETLEQIMILAGGLPVIIATGWTDDATKAIIKCYPVAGILWKGESWSRLTATLDKLLGLHPTSPG